MKEFFKPEDFNYEWDNRAGSYQNASAKISNNILNKHLESCPVVYLDKHHNLSHVDEIGFTHKARLFGIEEIKKEKCEHIPHQQVFIEGSYRQKFKCKLCHVELVATWSEKK